MNQTREPSAFPVSRTVLWAMGVASVVAFSPAAQAQAPTGRQTLELIQAIQDGLVRAELRFNLNQPGELRMSLDNRSNQLLILHFGQGVAAVPDPVSLKKARDARRPARKTSQPRTSKKAAGKSNKKSDPKKPSEPREPLLGQAGAVGGFRDRGAFGGGRRLRLSPNATELFSVPFLTSQLGDFQPDPRVSYQLVRAADWSEDPKVRRLLAEFSRRTVTLGTAQAAFWSFVQQLPISRLRLLKARDVNDAEFLLAQLLTDRVARGAEIKTPTPLRGPARLYLQIHHQPGEKDLAPAVAKILKAANTSGLIGLPVIARSVRQAPFQFPAEQALSVGCRVALETTDDGVDARISLLEWDGTVHRPTWETRVPLGRNIDPRKSLAIMDSALLRRVVRLRAVPATPGGLAALEDLVAAGVTVNVTLIFTQRQYAAARDAVWRGAQRRDSRDRFKSVYSIFVSRVDVYA
ncbi:MAG: hypothetical protein N2C14_23020, partial [Planctomycetales bacterium]